MLFFIYLNLGCLIAADINFTEIFLTFHLLDGVSLGLVYVFSVRKLRACTCACTFMYNGWGRGNHQCIRAYFCTAFSVDKNRQSVVKR